MRTIIVTVTLLLAATACGQGESTTTAATQQTTTSAAETTTTAGEQTTTSAAPAPTACDNSDGHLDNLAFVFVTSPTSGERVASPLTVTGCGTGFEGTLSWTLTDHTGTILAEGFTTAGSLEPGSFTFDVEFTATGLAYLRVADDGGGDEGGFPPAQDIVPLILGN